MAFPASFNLSSRPSFSTFNGLGKDSNLVILEGTTPFLSDRNHQPPAPKQKSLLTGWHSAVELAEFFLTLQKVILLEPMDSPQF